jgi:hypothetical protein
MRRIFSLVRRGVVLPFRLMWRGYNGLWWAFGDELAVVPGGAEGHAPASGRRSLEKTLKVGFGSTLAASAMMAIGTFAGEENGAFSPATAWVLWGWATMLAGVISIWAVKHVSRQQALRNAAGWRGHAGAAAAGFADMGREVAGVAVRAKDVSVTAGKHVGSAGKHVVSAGKATCEYARRVRGWVRPRTS